MQQIRAIISYILSFRKKNWTLWHYPVRTRHFDIDQTEVSSRSKPIAWTAQIINWYQMDGHGHSKEEALASLASNFEQYKANNPLPRPGTHVPLQFAKADLVQRYEAIARDFLQRIFDLNYDECFISDESSLWDFHGEETNDQYLRKIAILYGVDVSDIEGARLGKIFERIYEKGRT